MFTQMKKQLENSINTLKQIFLSVMLFALSTFGAAQFAGAQSNPPAGNASPELVKEVRAFMDEAIRANMSGDSSVISRQLAETYISTSSPNNIVRGKADNLEYTAKVQKRPKVEYEYDIADLRIFDHGETVIANYIINFRSKMDGKTFSRSHRATGVFTRRNGKLLEIAFHTSEIPTNNRVAVKLDQKQMDAIVGVYEATPPHVLTIKRDGEKLIANLPPNLPNQPPMEFFALNENTFFIKANPYNSSTWTFVRDASGNVSQVVIHTLDDRVLIRKKIK